MNRYQPQWVDGRTTGTAERPCVDRYDAFLPSLEEASRNAFDGLHVLDVGAAEGYFTARIADELDASVTAVDPNPRLADVSKRPHVTVIPKRLGPVQLARLPRHDVVLALSVLHHFEHWKAALKELVACRDTAIIEVPHPSERWMRSAAARHQLGALHDAVAKRPGARLLGEFERTSRDGRETFLRPMYALPGTVRTVTGRVFGGAGSNSRNLRRHADSALTHTLGYAPFPGSLNLNIGKPPASILGEPWATWARPQGRRKAVYKIWRAWIGDMPVHAMIPHTSHVNTIEIWAPAKLRDALDLVDGSRVTVDVEVSNR